MEMNAPFFPREPSSVEETGLSLGAIVDLVAKTLYYVSEAPAYKLAQMLGLPLVNVLDRALDSLKSQQAADVAGSSGMGAGGYRYYLTERGRQIAREAFERSLYAGKAPVPLSAYCDAVVEQSGRTTTVSIESIERAFNGLVIPRETLNQLGAAVNSGRSMFLFGAPGDGKTAMAERVSNLLGGDIWLPHAVEIDGQIIKVYDPAVHQGKEEATASINRPDARWVRCRRPTVISGGELSLSSLDLRYDPISRFYEPPLQMLANGGMYLIDDFGRQQVSPRELLNRWIVPLEKRVDYLSLNSGKKIAIPFHTLVVFSTNLEPLHLVDEAFLRRIRYKIHVQSPDQEQFREIFKRVCQMRGISYIDAAVTYLFHEQYGRRRLPLRACHPRDLLDQLVDAANYMHTPPVLSKELLDIACDTYFVTPRINPVATPQPRQATPAAAVTGSHA